MLKAITIAKNEEKFIGECVKRVLAQTHPVHSYVIIDDNSLDKTTNIVRELNDGRIRLLRADDLRMSVHRTQGAEGIASSV